MQGSFSGGTRRELRQAYGAFGSAWRAGLLRLLSHEVDNERFLVDGIAVAPEARGRGVGTALIDALCRARALYEREGFIATRTDRLGLLRFAFGFDSATTMIRVLS